MPTFCRHNRFIERCPICSRTLPGNAPASARSPRAKAPARGSRPGGSRSARAGASGASGASRQRRGESLRVHHEGRAQDDGYRSALLPGVRASADADRLCEEIAFASGRLLALSAAPWGLYGEALAVADSDLEQATWMCFLIVYLGPLEDAEDPFAGIREALRRPRYEPDELDGIPLGPRSSHDPARGTETLLAYRNWVQRAGGSQAAAFSGDPGWSPQRRFERLFERLALPGFARMGRYELLVVLGRLGLYELQADSLELGRGVAGPGGAGGAAGSGDLATLAAKRLFAIGDPMNLERRARSLAQELAVPLETLDLALANWASPQRATLGRPPDSSDPDTLERARKALAL